jgi:hypothetical protein
MSYELPDIVTYEWGQDATFGATAVQHFIVGPKGKVGFVRDISCDVTTSLGGTTTVPEIDVGITSADATYGRYRLGNTISLGYGVGFYQASNELWVGNPPRNLQDYVDHVKLDGCSVSGVSGGFQTAGVAGGTFLTVALPGRIPASGAAITNVVSGTSSAWRVTMRDPLPYNLTVNQLVNIRGAAGVTGGNQGATNYINGKISAISTTQNYFEVSGSTFGGTYTGGGFVDYVVTVTLLAGTGTSVGGGYGRVKIEWVGPVTP